MRVYGLLLLSFVFFLASSVRGATLDELISAAQSVPPEFSADALIRIAALDQVEKSRKIELLTLAYQRASAAQQPFKRHAALLRSDGSPGYWNRVFSQDLDGLSLRLRAIEALQPLDNAKARELFVQIPTPAPPRLTCEDFQVYDVSRYYSVLGSMAQQSAADSFHLLQPGVGAMTSSVQVAAMASVLASAPVSDADFNTLLSSFTAALGKITGDDRAFTASTSVGKEILALVEECKRRKISPLPVIEAYRVYLVINLSANRCADNGLMSGGITFGIYSSKPVEQTSADFVGFFNANLHMPPLQPIQDLEATPAKVDGVATGPKVCQDDGCKAVAAGIRTLLLSPAGAPYLPAEREKPEWQENLRGVLSAVAQWKPSKDTPPAEYFRERTAAYSDLLNLALNSASREPILRAFYDFVNRNPFAATSRIEWFLPVNGLAGRLGLDPKGFANFASELQKSGDPIIALYANLEVMAPRPPDRVLALL